MPDKKNLSTKPTKGSTNAKKFKGKQDLRSNNSKGTNGMHNNIPLTKEHQMMLGEGEVMPTPSNPRGFSKRQLTVLSFFKDREVKMNSNQSNDDGHLSSWGNEKNSFRGIKNTYKNGFNLNMFQPSGEGTPTRNPNSDSESPAYNPTSPPYSVETTESSGKARTQGQGKFTPVREPEPVVDFDSEERTDMSMFIAPVAMNSA